MELLGTPIDLGRGDLRRATSSPASPTTSRRGRTATPPRSCSGATRGSCSRARGHVAALVNPPGNPKARYRTAPAGANPASARRLGGARASSAAAPGGRTGRAGSASAPVASAGRRSDSAAAVTRCSARRLGPTCSRAEAASARAARIARWRAKQNDGGAGRSPRCAGRRSSHDSAWTRCSCAASEPRGDGRPVVLVPGFAGGDWTLQHLAFWLRRSGYDAVRCNFIVNAGCGEKALARVERRVIECSERSGRRVAVLGHSLGGYLARAAAARMPDRVSHAVALGAGLSRPFDVAAPALAGVAVARAVRGNDRCLSEGCGCTFTAGYTCPFPDQREPDEHLQPRRRDGPLGIVCRRRRRQRRGDRLARRTRVEPQVLPRDRRGARAARADSASITGSAREEQRDSTAAALALPRGNTGRPQTAVAAAPSMG